MKIELEELLHTISTSEKPIILDFYADWCGPCKALSPIFDTVMLENTNVVGIKINADDSKSIVDHFGIRGLPTIIILDKVELSRKSGSMTKSSLINFIDTFTNF